MSRSFNIFSLLFIVVVIVTESCVSHDIPQYECSGETVSYAEDVDPIILSRCAVEGCHNGDNGEDKNWTEFDLFQAKSQTARSYVIQRIMPPDGATPLTQAEINAIACWVDQGSQNN